MQTYIVKPKSVKKSEVLLKNFSLSGKDYRHLQQAKETKPLIDFVSFSYTGKEIGSNAYMDKSKYRFLKTVNLGNDFCLETTKFEYCKPVNKIYPKRNDILIAKDGGGQGLGESAIYNLDNDENQDSVSAGILGIRTNEEKRNYIFGFLKSQYFKNFVDLNTPQGSTIRHSKKVALDFNLPFPTTKNNSNPENVEKLVSLIVQNIIDKEEKIKLKNEEIDEEIERELKENQKENNFKYSYPKVSELKNEGRLDTGLYEKDFKKVDFLITNYKGEYFKLPLDKFKSGSTPKVRMFNPKNKKYKWVTPTLITDEGFYKPEITINMDNKNNLSKDCILIINRTSKGKKGEYVGISCFYEIDSYGLGQHNQGLYKIEDFSKTEKLFLVCLLNSKIFRKICGCMSIGSKMKEIKTNDFSNLKFPNFSESKQQQVAKKYYNPQNKNQNLTFENYLEKEKTRNSEIGIFQLNMEIFKLREKLESLVNKIVMNKKVDIDFEY